MTFTKYRFPNSPKQHLQNLRINAKVRPEQKDKLLKSFKSGKNKLNLDLRPMKQEEEIFSLC